MEKLTQRDYFNFAIVNFGGEIEGDVKDISAEDMVAFFEGRIAMLDKKKSGTKAESESDSKLKADIKTVMADMSPSTATTILNKVKTIGDYENLSNQKVSAMLKKLELAGEVNKTKDKKSTLWGLA